MSLLKVRSALLVDSEDISVLHYNAWIRSYKDILPKQFFSQISLEKTKDHWFKILSEKGPEEIFLLAFKGEELVGFVNGGKSREKGPTDGELYALFVKSEKQGVGKFLLKSFVEELRLKKTNGFFAWVLSESKGLKFFQK